MAAALTAFAEGNLTKPTVPNQFIQFQVRGPEMTSDERRALYENWLLAKAFHHHTASFSPANWNWGHFTNPKIDELLAKAQETFVPTERDNGLASAHELIVDEAPWVRIVHDLNPRAMSAKVKGFRPAQSWFQDFTSVYMD